MYSFTLTDKQMKDADKFLEDCYAEDARRQGQDIADHGAIGGATTYSFTPTSLGVIIKVSFQGTHHKGDLDLTEYELF